MAKQKTPPPMRPWPADAVTRWPITKIKPYPRNARTHSKEQIALIAESISKFGFTAPLLVDEAGVLIYGHGRHAAAKSLGIAEVPVCIAEGWTEQEKAAYRIADNQIALRSDWDMPLLHAEMKELSLGDYPLLSLGFTASQITEFGLTVPTDATLDLTIGPSGVSLAERFGAVPFTVLSAREGWWQARKRSWLALGMQPELGRGDDLVLKLPDKFARGRKLSGKA